MSKHLVGCLVVCLVSVVGCGKVKDPGSGVDAAMEPPIDSPPSTTQHTVTVAATGAGTVTSTPAGIDCGATCSADFDEGASITLHAEPAPGASFAGWSGGGCSGTADCTIVVSADTNVTAAFSAAVYPLTVTPSGAGSGTIVSTPAGIDCGSTCSHEFAHGTMVTLSVVPAAHSVFSGWSGGGCSGTAPCTVTVTAATTVTATFAIEQHLLTVTKTGMGTITSTPAGIDCGATCSAMFDYGTMVTLAAAPSANNFFVGWSGSGCTGTGACTVAIDAAKTVSANFCASGMLTFNFTGAPQQATIPACVRSVVVDVRGAQGGAGMSGTAATGAGGLGGRTQATIPLASGDTLTVFVGGAGGNAPDSNTGGAGGFNGGAPGGPFNGGGQSGGGGGGASDIRRNGTGLGNRVVIGAGGGGGTSCSGAAANGGGGGGLVGQAAPAPGATCPDGVPPTGGTQSAGGGGSSYPGYCNAGSGALGIGGLTCPDANRGSGGGGGGGYYGGGGGTWYGGGGGSSGVLASGATAVTHTPATQAGNGSVTIRWPN